MRLLLIPTAPLTVMFFCSLFLSSSRSTVVKEHRDSYITFQRRNKPGRNDHLFLSLSNRECWKSTVPSACSRTVRPSRTKFFRRGDKVPEKTPPLGFNIFLVLGVSYVAIRSRVLRIACRILNPMADPELKMHVGALSSPEVAPTFYIQWIRDVCSSPSRLSPAVIIVTVL